jgi:serine/threonine protein kinase
MSAPTPDPALQEILSSLAPFIVRFEDFKIRQSIGHGSYGIVYLADYLPSRQPVALKKLHVSDLTGVHLLYFCREVAILAQASHPYLLGFVGFTASAPFCIATEFVSNGSLFDAISQRRPLISPLQKGIIAYCVAEGMAFLHRAQIMHRDLKPMNILLDDRLMPRICDFGISRFLGGHSANCTLHLGTPLWMAPEQFGSGGYDLSVDVFAFGTVLWFMLSETLPFEGLEGVQIALTLEKGMRTFIPRETPQGLANLIRRCWAQDPHVRPSFEEIGKVVGSGDVHFPGTDPARLRAVIAGLAGHLPVQHFSSSPLQLPNPEFDGPPLPRSRSGAVVEPPETESKKPDRRKAKKTAQGTRLLRRRSLAVIRNDDDGHTKVASVDTGRLTTWAADELWIESGWLFERRGVAFIHGGQNTKIGRVEIEKSQGGVEVISEQPNDLGRLRGVSFQAVPRLQGTGGVFCSLPNVSSI